MKPGTAALCDKDLQAAITVKIAAHISDGVHTGLSEIPDITGIRDEMDLLFCILDHHGSLCGMRAWQGCESEQDQALAGMFPHGDRLFSFVMVSVRSIFLPRRGYCLLRSLRYPSLCLFLSACGYDS